MNRAAVRTGGVRFFLALALLSCGAVRADGYGLVIAHGRVMDPESGLDSIANIGISDGKSAPSPMSPWLASGPWRHVGWS